MTAVQEGHLPTAGIGQIKVVKKKENEPQISPPIDCLDIPWRGHGGRPPTFSSVQFDRQLDKISVWVEEWNHDQRCQVVEGLLRRSNYNQFLFLSTTLQPILHRDFMYTAKSQFPTIEFLPPSTHTSRKLKEKLVYTRQNNFYRLKSAHYKNEKEIKQQVLEKQSIRFPDILSPVRRHEDLSPSQGHLPAKSASPPYKKILKVHRSHGNQDFDRWLGEETNPIYSNVPHIRNDRYIEMPVRRHIQDENSPRQSKMSKSTMSSPSAGTMSTLKSSLLRKDDEKKSAPPSHKKSANVRIPNLPEEAKILYNWFTEIWSDVKRNEFLHKFLLKLDPRQHYFLSSFLAVRQHRDFIQLLPDNVALKIFGFLTVPELLITARVSKRWQKIANNNDLWKSKCALVKLEVPVSNQPNWKQIYRDNMYLRLNWNDGLCKTVDFKGHASKVVGVTFDQHRLASGSVDRSIRVWDIKTGHLQQVLKGHNKGVWCLNFFTQNLLISGSHDGTIKVWNLQTGTCAKTILAHDGPVWAMVRHDNTLVTGSQDRTAKIWNIGRCLLLATLVGHNAAVFAVDMSEDGSLVITGSADRSVRIWTTETGKCKKVIWVSQTTSIMAVSYSKGYLACSYGETVCLYKVEGAKLLQTYNEHIKRIECVRLDILDTNKPSGILVSAGKDGKLIYWDISKENSIQTFIGHKGESVNAVHFDELRIASAAHDHKIRIWDFNV